MLGVTRGLQPGSGDVCRLLGRPPMVATRTSVARPAWRILRERGLEPGLAWAA